MQKKEEWRLEFWTKIRAVYRDATKSISVIFSRYTHNQFPLCLAAIPPCRCCSRRAVVSLIYSPFFPRFSFSLEIVDIRHAFKMRGGRPPPLPFLSPSLLIKGRHLGWWDQPEWAVRQKGTTLLTPLSRRMQKATWAPHPPPHPAVEDIFPRSLSVSLLNCLDDYKIYWRSCERVCVCVCVCECACVCVCVAKRKSLCCQQMHCFPPSFCPARWAALKNHV